MNQSVNVAVYTSLPPNINKPEPYFYLNLHITYLKWLSKIHNNFEDILVKVLWWGEESEGAIFHPRCVNLAGYKQNVRTHAMYPVCVPLKHFSAYLNDMGKLGIDIIDKNKKFVIGKAYVDNLEQLAFNKGLQSLCIILNEKNNKIGEVMIAMSLESVQNQKIVDQDVFQNTEVNSIPKENFAPNIQKTVIHNREAINEKFLTDSIEKDVKSENFLDKLIEKSKNIRETISIDVKNDEINNEIFKKTFPNCIDHPEGLNITDHGWLNNVLHNPSENDLSVNDISKINTESILKFSENFSLHRPKENINNDRETIKLIAGSDSFSLENGDFRDKYQFLSDSEAYILKKLDKEISSDDDPFKNEEIIEELFYKKAMPEDKVISESQNSQNKTSANNVQTVAMNENVSSDKLKDFEIYQSLSQHNNSRNLKNEDFCYKSDKDYNQPCGDIYDDDDDNFKSMPIDSAGRDWYKNISFIKVCLDMLWLNSSPQPWNKNSRSRSQSSNYSSDREKLRRSYDSGSSFNNSSNSYNVTKPPTSQSFQIISNNKYYIDYKFPSNSLQNTGSKTDNISFDVSSTRIPVKLSSFNQNASELNGVKSWSLDHVTTFPMTLNDGSLIQKWWKGNIRFKLISQDISKKETVVGIGVVPLRNIISTNNFYRLIPIRLPRSKLTRNNARVIIGSLALRTSMILSKTDITFPSDSRSQIQVASESKNKYSRSLKISPNSYNKRNFQKIYSLSSHTSPLPVVSTKLQTPFTLESFLYVSNIRHINPKSTNNGYKSTNKSCNLFIIGRLLWATNQKIKSPILWGTSKVSENQPVNELENFKLVAKSTLVLTGEILEKLKDNYAILEVWDVSGEKTKESLFGLVKIPLNISYLSFKNEKIRNTILNNVFPLLASDGWINIEDPLTGKSKGQIHVLLAMGSPEQIKNLQFSKENTSNGHWNRNFLSSNFASSELVEHSFELDIESLRNLHLEKYSEGLLQESYIYIQYYFPLQNSMAEKNGKNWESAVFRSNNNPVQSNVDISDTNCHRFRLSPDCSLKNMLNKHFEILGKKHVLFELYLKQYNPFPISKLIAKGRLQVSSLFQLINQHSVDIDSLADTVTQQQIPIIMTIEDSEYSSGETVGVLNVRLCYRTKLMQTIKNPKSAINASPYDQPIIRVEILSATGLQYAAQSIVETHPELQYPSVTGVNSQVKFWLTDESNKHCRSFVNSKGIQRFQFNYTKVVSRTFTPKYDYVCELLLGPIIDELDDENCSSLYKTLAEKILCGIYQLNVEVYHNTSNSIYCDFDQNSSHSKILIGKGRTSISDLLLRSSGFMGPFWMPIFSPMNEDSELGGTKLNWPSKRNHDLFTIDKRKTVGAVEIRLGFLDKMDRKTILQLAMDSGYVVPWTNRLETEDLVWQQMDVHGFTFKNIIVNVEEVEISEKLINSIFTPEVGYQKSSLKILVRYRMYKQPVSNSPNFFLNEHEISEKVYIPINHSQTFCYRVSSDLFRYLRESKLEVQVWVIYGSHNQTNFDDSYKKPDNPNDVRLLGSAFFELSNLILPCDQPEKCLNYILPIWKRGVPHCGNSNVSVSIKIFGSMSPLPGYNSDNDENDRMNSLSNNNSAIRTGSSYTNQISFPVHIIIEKAVNLKTNISGNENLIEIPYKPLNYFVSFPCAEDKSYKNSSIIKGYKDVVWNFECDTRLNYSFLTDDKMTLDFKVFYSVTESEQSGEVFDDKVMVGIVKLDLSLLLKGFERVIGWYNIIDMQGDCQGQIKVGVTPLVPLVSNSAIISKNMNQTINQTTTNKPFTIEDHQNYLSSVRMRLRGQVEVSEPQDSLKQPILDSGTQDFMSKSLLFDTLKEKLKELDTMNEMLRKKVETQETGINLDHSKGNLKLYNLPNDLPVTTPETVFRSECGVNTDKIESHNENCNNNNHSDESFNYEDQNFESDEIYEPSEEEPLSVNHNCDSFGICINDPDQPQQFLTVVPDQEHKTNIFPTYQKDQNDLSNDSGSEPESCEYSCEIDNTSPVNTSRSISVRNAFHDIEDVEHIDSRNQLVNDAKSDQALNDSWDEAMVEETGHLKNDVPDIFSERKPTSSSIIPNFFPQSFDFYEKMQTLKKNIDMSSEAKNINFTNSYKQSSLGQSEKNNQVINISDKEASRISKIFGLKKS